MCSKLSYFELSSIRPSCHNTFSLWRWHNSPHSPMKQDCQEYFVCESLLPQIDEYLSWFFTALMIFCSNFFDFSTNKKYRYERTFCNFICLRELACQIKKNLSNLLYTFLLQTSFAFKMFTWWLEDIFPTDSEYILN